MKKILVLAFCVTATSAFSQIKSLMKTPDQKEAQAAQEELQAERDAYFEGRPDAPGSDVESFKENPPVKKEKFAAKLERFKSEGFKVAVVMSSWTYTTRPQPQSSTTSASSQITLKGRMPAIDATAVLEAYTAKMNAAFETDLFEMVDLSKISVKEVKFGKVDDWEITKYRMVVTVAVTPEYDYNKSGGKYEATLNVNVSAPMVEYVNEKKGVKMKYPVRAGGLGFYKSDVYKSDADPEIGSIDELNTLVNPPSGDALVTKLKEGYDSNIDKYIEKLKK